MTDHVASAIEEKLNKNAELEFYDAFKTYMLNHKQELLRSSFKYRWDLDKKVLKVVGENMFDPLIAGLFLLILSIFYFADFSSINVEYLLIPQAILGCGAILPLLIYRYLKVSFVHHLVFLIYMYNSFLSHFVNKGTENNEFVFTIIALISLWINMSALKTIIESFRYYKEKFKEA